jgi:hypothetical protein
MNTCPECGVKIDRLGWQRHVCGMLEPDWHIQLSVISTQYQCPECGVALFSNEDNANTFLKTEAYPSDNNLYKCSKCNVMTNKVYYHAWQVGDLCEKCFSSLKHLNMECRIEDEGVVDYLSREELKPLWRIKKKYGLSIVEQILEALEDYIAKHFLDVEEKYAPPINNRIKRFKD